jgi:hypothetical protein
VLHLVAGAIFSLLQAYHRRLKVRGSLLFVTVADRTGGSSTMAGKGGARKRNQQGVEDEPRRRRLETARALSSGADLAQRINFHASTDEVAPPPLADTQYLVGGNSKIPKGDRFPNLSDNQIRAYVTGSFTCACCDEEKNSFDGPVHRKSITGMLGTCFGLCTTLAG